MRIVHQRRGSRQRAKGERVEVVPNYGGQGGSDFIALENKNGWFLLVPESEADVKELMRQAHVLHHNYRTDEERAKAEGRVLSFKPKGD